MDVRLSDVYHWQRPELEEKYKQWDLSTEGSVQELREHLTFYICLKGEMDTKGVSFGGGSNEERGTFSESPQSLRDNAEGSVLSDLLKDVPCLTSEEPKAILKFIVDLKAIYELNLVPDNVFLMRLPKVQGSLLTFFGECIRHGDSWEHCKARVLKEYFPLFVMEKMIRELVVFHFQERECLLREFIKEVVDAAEFLQYRASEGEIGDRMLMNLHLDILAQAAILPRPGSYRELRDMAGLIEERMAVLAERQRSDTGLSSSQMGERDSLSNKPSGTAVEGRRSSKNGPNCWSCGKQGHVQGNCKERNSPGAVAAIAPNREPPVRVLGQVDVEANAHGEVEATQIGGEIRSGTIDSVGGKGGHAVRERDVVKGKKENN